MLKYYILIIFATLCGSFGAYFLKKASNTRNSIIKLIFFNFDFYIGGFLYFLGSILCIIALKFLPYGIVYFFMSLTYLWSFLIGIFILKESLSINKIINLILIICGIIMITF